MEKETVTNPGDGKTYEVQYRGREEGEDPDAWYRVGGQPDNLSEFEANAHMAHVQATDTSLELRVQPSA